MRRFDIDRLIKTIRDQELTIEAIAMLSGRFELPSRTGRSRRGLSPSGIARVLKKTGIPSIRTIELLCAVTKVDPADYWIEDRPAKMGKTK